MPYYGAGDYYRAGSYYRGDYYRAGGIFGSIGKVLGKVAKTAISLTPVGRVIQTVAPIAKQLIAGPRPRPSGLPVIAPMGSQFEGALDEFGGGPFTGGGGFSGRRRMNVTNVKALRRAGRRVRGFLKIARRLGALPVGTSGKKLFKKKRRA